MSVRGGDITLLLNKGLGLSPTSSVLLHLLPKKTRGEYISTHSKTKTLVQGQVILNRGSDWTCRWSGSYRKAFYFTRSARITQGDRVVFFAFFPGYSQNLPLEWLKNLTMPEEMRLQGKRRKVNVSFSMTASGTGLVEVSPSDIKGVCNFSRRGLHLGETDLAATRETCDWFQEKLCLTNVASKKTRVKMSMATNTKFYPFLTSLLEKYSLNLCSWTWAMHPPPRDVNPLTVLYIFLGKTSSEGNGRTLGGQKCPKFTYVLAHVFVCYHKLKH